MARSLPILLGPQLKKPTTCKASAQSYSQHS
ncbi:MAG: hypothetical protein ACI9HY_004025, partial [Planctomycetaceae bacterium]